MAFLLALFLTVPAAADCELGEARFEAAGCRSCHKVGERGGNTGPDLTLVGFRRSRDWLSLWLKSPHAWKPDTKMPEPALKGPERTAIVEFLSEQRGSAWKPVLDGSALYRKAGCVACHGAKGAGGHPNNNVPGNAIPSLAKSIETFTLDELVKKITYGVRPVPADLKGPEPLVSMPAWEKILTDEEIKAVAGYLLSFGAGKPAPDW